VTAAIAIAVAVIAGTTGGLLWLARKLKAGPGPGSRLERLLADHERDEAARRALEDPGDEEEEAS
jgi:hypothetical protein